MIDIHRLGTPVSLTKATVLVEQLLKHHVWREQFRESRETFEQIVFVSLGLILSSETQGQSVGSGERARRKFSSTGERAPGYRLSPSYFQKFKRMPTPDWAQKMCPIGEQFLLSSFREFVPDGYCLATLARFVH